MGFALGGAVAKAGRGASNMVARRRSGYADVASEVVRGEYGFRQEVVKGEYAIKKQKLENKAANKVFKKTDKRAEPLTKVDARYGDVDVSYTKRAKRDKNGMRVENPPHYENAKAAAQGAAQGAKPEAPQQLAIEGPKAGAAKPMLALEGGKAEPGAIPMGAGASDISSKVESGLRGDSVKKPRILPATPKGLLNVKPSKIKKNVSTAFDAALERRKADGSSLMKD